MNGDQPVQPGSDQQPETPWQYKPNTSPQTTTRGADLVNTGIQDNDMDMTSPAEMEATWSASEFIDHAKGTMWFVTLGGVTFVILIILYFFTHDIVSMAAVVIMAVLLGVVARRKPRVMEYHLDSSGLTIGDAFHPYAEFKAFAIMNDGNLNSIMLLPLKRFMPPISVYYSPEDEQQITDVISRYLPMEMRERDAIDRFSRRIRF